MTKEELAAKLNGREYGSILSHQEGMDAERDGLVVVFGYSDDNVEFRGAIYDEVDAYDGTTVKINRRGVVQRHTCDCKYCGYKGPGGEKIKAQWCEVEWYSWTFETEIPHATFDIMEDGETFCRGIVIDVRDLPE